MPEENDSNFAWDDFYEKVNNVLIGNFGNYVNRVLTLSKDLDFSKFSSIDVFSKRRDRTLTSQELVEERVQQAFEEAYEALDSCKYKNYLDAVMSLSSFANFLMSIRSPWKLKETDRAAFDKVMFNLTFIVVALNYLIAPLLPETAKKLSDSLGLSEVTEWPALEEVLEFLGTKAKDIKIGDVKALFSKLERLDIDFEKTNLPKA